MAYSSSTVHIDIVDITYHLMQTINNEMKILVGVFFCVFFCKGKCKFLFYFISAAALSLAILTLVMSEAAFILIRSSWQFWFSNSPPKSRFFFRFLSIWSYPICGGIGSNGFHIKWIIGTHGNWKNQNPGGCFGATS